MVKQRRHEKSQIPPNFVVERFSSAPHCSRGEALPMAPPVSWRESPAFHGHTPLPGRRGATLGGSHGGPARQARHNRLRAAGRMRAAYQPHQLPGEGVMALIPPGGGPGQPGIFAHGPPAGLLGPAPGPHACIIGQPGPGGDGLGTAAPLVAARHHAPALALATRVPQGGERRATRLAARERDGHELAAEPAARGAEAVAQARPRQPRPDPGERAVEALRQEAPDPRGRLWRGRRPLQCPRGRGQGRGTWVLAVPQRSDEASPDHGWHVPCVGATGAVLSIDQAIGGQRPSTPRRHHHDTLVPERTDPPREGPRCEMAEHRTPLPTAATRGRPQGVAGHRRAPGARAPDAVGADCDHRWAGGALETPERPPSQTDTAGMRVARHGPSPIAGRLVWQLNAQGHGDGQDTFETRLALAQPLQGGRFRLHSAGDGPGFPCWCGGAAQGSPQVRGSEPRLTPHGGHPSPWQDHREGLGALPLTSMECGAVQLIPNERNFLR